MSRNRQSHRDYRDRKRTLGTCRDWSLNGHAIEDVLLAQVEKREADERAKRRANEQSADLDTAKVNK